MTLTWYALPANHGVQSIAEHIHPIRFRPLTLDAVVLLDVLGPLDSLLVAVVPDGDVGTGLGESLSHGQTDSRTRTGDDGRLPLVGEERQDLQLGGSSAVVVAKMPFVHCAIHDEGGGVGSSCG